VTVDANSLVLAIFVAALAARVEHVEGARSTSGRDFAFVVFTNAAVSPRPLAVTQVSIAVAVVFCGTVCSSGVWVRAASAIPLVVAVSGIAREDAADFFSRPDVVSGAAPALAVHGVHGGAAVVGDTFVHERKIAWFCRKPTLWLGVANIFLGLSGGRRGAERGGD